MILALVRQSSLLRGMGRPLIASFTLMNTCLGVLGLLMVKLEFDPLPYMIAASWIAAVTPMGWLIYRKKAVVWELSLPVSARDVWMSQYLAAVLLTFTAWLLTSALGMGLLLFVNSKLDQALADPVHYVSAAGIALVGAMPIVLWALVRMPGIALLPPRRSLMVVEQLVDVFFVFLVVMSLRFPWPILAAFVITTVLSLRWCLRSIPNAWSPFSEAGQRSVAADDGAWSFHRWRWTLDARLAVIALRSVPRGIVMVVVLMPMLFLFGILLGGGSSLIGADFDMELLFLPMTIYTLLSASAFPVGGLKALDAFPVNRARIFVLLQVPLLFLLLVGYVTGTVVNNHSRDHDELIVFADQENSYGVLIPVEYFELLPEGETGLVAAPWGESHPQKMLAVLEKENDDDEGRIWKPFTTPRGSSLEYVAWQLSRAVDSVYGVQVDPVQLAEQYFVVNKSGGVELREDKLTLSADHPEWKAKASVSNGPVVLFGLGLVWLPLLTIYFSMGRIKYRSWKRKIALWGGMAFTLALHLLLFMSALFQSFDPEFLEVVIMLKLSVMAESMPAGPLTLWLVSLAIFTAGMVLAARQFQALEADVASCDKCFL